MILELYKIKRFLWGLTIFICVTSCKKIVDVTPPAGSLTENGAYSSDETAISIVTGIYTSMSEGGSPFTGNLSLPFYASLSADEFTLYSGVTNNIQIQYFKNALSAIENIKAGSENWNPLYNYIYRTNAALEGLVSSKASGLSAPVRKQLIGEVKFLRAFYYFYLVNLFGDVPLVLSTDPQINTLLARSSKIKVYEQIIADLKEAKDLLSETYLSSTLLSSTSERVRPTKWAAIALLARTYLYNGEWAKAEEQATALINNSAIFGLQPLNNVFLKNSKESIWQLQPTIVDYNTQEARLYVILPVGPSDGDNPVYLSKNFLNSFEANDQRKVYGNWVDTTIYAIAPSILDTVAYPNKYKVNISQGVSSPGSMTEYLTVFRLGEQYLIRAEARAKQNNIAGAQLDLNSIRNRAGLINTTANDEASLLIAILNERRHELFTEWGHRWFDLKRSGKIDEVMSIVTPQKANGAPWQSYQQLYPIALIELLSAPNLTQNPGYN